MRKKAILTSLLLLILLTTYACQPASTVGQINITGRITSITNGETHYRITDDSGKTIKLVLDAETIQASGGHLAIDRKRVTITGEYVDGSTDNIHVLSIQVLPEYP